MHSFVTVSICLLFSIVQKSEEKGYYPLKKLSY